MIWLMEIFKDLAKRTAWDKVLRDKSFIIAINLKYNWYQRGLASMVCNFFDEKDASIADKSASSLLHLKTIFGVLI